MKRRAYSKYRAKRTTYNGMTFPSKGECAMYKVLEARQHKGLIRNLKRQVPYEIIGRSAYGRALKAILDYEYEELVDGRWLRVRADFKGKFTDVARIKFRLIAERYGFVVRIFTRKDLNNA
jgi:hypothetical protein